MESTNYFAEGMDKDISKLSIPNTKYLDAYNLRLTSEKGNSNFALENVKGNSLSFSIPDTYPVYRLKLTSTTGNVNIFINGESNPTPLTTTSTTSGQQLAEYITNDNTNYPGEGTDYFVSYGSNYIVIWSATLDPLPAVNSAAITIATLVPALADLQPIGFTTIRDDIYIYTTNNTSTAPTSSNGQIWKLTYDNTSLSTTLTLVYNNLLNFSTYNAIAPTATLGRYENDDIQRVYWTDFYNPLRSLNVGDSQVMATDISTVNIVPVVDFSIPVLQKIQTGGNLKSGCYYAAYRLKKTNGSITNYSELSNPVYLVSTAEGNGDSNFYSYIGDNPNTSINKNIKWQIKFVDTDFDTIEIVIVNKAIDGQLPTVVAILEEPVPASGTFEFTYTGNEDETIILLEDFISLNTGFTHCKTIATKDNRLFAGNVKNTTNELDYDARAYRFNAALPGGSALINGATNITLSGPSPSYSGVPETHDAINPNQTTYKYDTSGNFGGTGLNISYQFGTVATKVDDTIDLGANSPRPFRHTNPDYNISYIQIMEQFYANNTDEIIFPLNGVNSSTKYSYYNSVIRGYQRGEVYRFGIQFFDKNKNPYFVKWIGDIKMPDYFDSDPTLTGNHIYEDGSAQPVATQQDYRLSFVASHAGATSAFIKNLYVKFTVANLNTIADKISGYKIVRVKRENTDKTVVGCGLIQPLYNSGANLYLSDSSGGTISTDAYVSIPNARTRRTNGIFVSPEYLFNPTGGFQTGDKLVINSYLSKNAAQVTENICPQAACTTNYNMIKFYDHTTEAGQVIFGAGVGDFDSVLTQMIPTSGNDTFTTITGFPFSNWTLGNTANTSTGLGRRQHLLEWTDNLNYDRHDLAAEKFYGRIERTLTNQYGGNTYSQRSNNEYISCNHYKPFIDGNGYSDTFRVFGGDTWVTTYDHQYIIKNWGSVQSWHSRGKGTNNGESWTWFFPVETTINTDLRRGNHINKDLIADDGSGASGDEDINYNNVYSEESDVVKFYPKPLSFNTTDIHDARIWASEVKINGETADSWSVFLSNNFKDLESSYGPINALLAFKDQMYSWQDRSFAVVGINERVTVPDNNGAEIVIGEGNILGKHIYISTNIGTKHQWSIVQSSNAIYWYDVINQAQFRFGGGLTQVSDIKGLQSYFANNTVGQIQDYDKPVYSGFFGTMRAGITGYFDHRYNELVMTFHDITIGRDEEGIPNSYTIVYNEQFNCYTGFYSFKPGLYIYDGKHIWSPNPSDNNDLYMHNVGDYAKYYNTIFTSTLKIAVNYSPKFTKVFDNLQWKSESYRIDSSDNMINQYDDTWNSIRVYNEYQNTDTQSVVIRTGYNTPTNYNTYRAERGWNFEIPRNRVLYSTNSPNIFTALSPTRKSFGERIRDKHIIVDFTYNNTSNYKFINSFISSIFRLSSR